MNDTQAKRIAELEAELAMERGAITNRDEALSQSNAWWGVEYRAMKARAEKAEAEVERLRHLEGEASHSGVSPSPPRDDDPLWAKVPKWRYKQLLETEAAARKERGPAPEGGSDAKRGA